MITKDVYNSQMKVRVSGLIQEQVKPLILIMLFHTVHGAVLMLLLFQSLHRAAFLPLITWNSRFIKDQKNHTGEEAVGLKI